MSNTFKKLMAPLVVLAPSLGASFYVEPVLAADINLYGYLSWRIEKVWDELAVDDTGQTVTEDAPREIALPSFNVMMLHNVADNVKFFANLNGADAEEITVSNAWGEYQVNDAFNVRLGKTYRRFGLYNEMLDAVPTYIGIEPPELFDKDHLILSRETLLMVHGWVPLGDGELRYSFSTDNGEGGPSADDNIPLGFDLRYDMSLNGYLVGVSGYTSNGDTVSDVGVGDGSPSTGVLPWMEKDDFSVIGLYAQYDMNNLKLQFAYWSSDHDATRDAASVVTVVENAGVNAAQRARFLKDPTAAVTEDNVNLDGDYEVNTWYVRAGYSFYLESGAELVPYFQWDSYENPETIQNKDYGGDNEAGLSDDGAFSKSTIGVIYRPIPQVAFKLDSSTHFQKFNGKDESYSEIRFDASYIFGQ